MALSLAALAANGRRLGRNIGRRVERIEGAGNANNATRRYREIMEQPLPKDAAGWRARNRALQQLDTAPGTRSATAGSIARRDATRARNDDLRARSADVNQRIRMSTQEIEEALKLARSDVRRKVRTTREGYGDTHATRMAEKGVDDARVGGTRNEMLSDLSTLERMKGYKGLTPKGAKAIEDSGAEAFGERYRDMNDAQKSAIWDEMERRQKVESLSSQEVQAMIKAILNDGFVVGFTEKINPDGTTYLKADFGTSFEDMKAQRARREKADELLEKYMEESEPNPFFEDIRGSTGLFG